MNVALPADPFAMLVSPEVVLERLHAASTRLEQLTRRVCRPLDKPLIAHRSVVDEEDGDDVGGELNMEDTACGGADFIDTRA